ncbi:MAG: NUDIX domain-containing protein [Gemmatimonadaceae bacterium]
MPTHTRVVAAVIRRSDRFLVCQRPAHKRHGLLWEFPGGKCEPDESDTDTARRELSEELDVATVRVGAEIFSIAELNSEFHIVFLPVEIRGEPNLKEHKALLWATLEELHTVALAPGDAQFVAFLSTNQ